MDDADYYRKDEIDLTTVREKIQIWMATAIMDGGTMFFYCRYEDKLFQIISRQFTIEGKHDVPEFLFLNETPVALHSAEEKLILRLIKESVNAADSLPFLPNFIKLFLWSRKKKAYWIYIFKREIARFIKSKEYLQLAGSTHSNTSAPAE